MRRPGAAGHFNRAASTLNSTGFDLTLGVYFAVLGGVFPRRQKIVLPTTVSSLHNVSGRTDKYPSSRSCKQYLSAD